MAVAPPDRRHVARREYRAPLLFRPSAVQPGEALDISELGTSFLSGQAVPHGTALEVFLVNRNVQLNGTVRYCHAEPDGRFRIGVDFDKPEPELVEVLTLAWERRNE